MAMEKWKLIVAGTAVAGVSVAGVNAMIGDANGGGVRAIELASSSEQALLDLDRERAISPTQRVTPTQGFRSTFGTVDYDSPPSADSAQSPGDSPFSPDSVDSPNSPNSPDSPPSPDSPASPASPNSVDS